MMPIPAGPYLPTSALVAVAWLGQRVPGIVAGQVATRLPRDLATWLDEGFVQVRTIPGAAEVDSGARRRGIAQIDAWGANAATDGSASAKPAVMKATRLAELIIRATEDAVQSVGGFGRPVTMPANYAAARVLSVYPMTEPSEVPDDPSGFGRVTFDLALDWARI